MLDASCDNDATTEKGNAMKTGKGVPTNRLPRQC